VGSAEWLDDGSIVDFAYHDGDEAVLKAKRDTSLTTCWLGGEITRRAEFCGPEPSPEVAAT